MEQKFKESKQSICHGCKFIGEDCRFVHKTCTFGKITKKEINEGKEIAAYVSRCAKFEAK